MKNNGIVQRYENAPDYPRKGIFFIEAKSFTGNYLGAKTGEFSG